MQRWQGTQWVAYQVQGDPKHKEQNQNQEKQTSTCSCFYSLSGESERQLRQNISQEEYCPSTSTERVKWTREFLWLRSHDLTHPVSPRIEPSLSQVALRRTDMRERDDDAADLLSASSIFPKRTQTCCSVSACELAFITMGGEKYTIYTTACVPAPPGLVPRDVVLGGLPGCHVLPWGVL